MIPTGLLYLNESVPDMHERQHERHALGQVPFDPSALVPERSRSWMETFDNRAGVSLVHGAVIGASRRDVVARGPARTGTQGVPTFENSCSRLSRKRVFRAAQEGTSSSRLPWAPDPPGDHPGAC